MNNKIPIKIVCIGDGAVGKTSILTSFTYGKFENNYEPTIYDNYSCELNYNNIIYTLNLWDTAGQEDFDSIRNLSYHNTDIFILCYSVISISSYNNIIKKWIPEIKKYNPTTPIILCATKTDLKNDFDFLTKHKITPLSTSHLNNLLENKNLFYNGIECSSKTSKNLIELFHLVIDSFNSSNQKQSNNCKCIIF